MDIEFRNLHQQYQDLHKKFDVFRGKVMTEEDNKAIVIVWDEIVAVYKQLNVILNFIGHRYKQSVETSLHFNAFLVSVNKALSKKGKK